MADVKKHPFLLPKMDLPSSPKERSILMSPRARALTANNEELGSPRMIAVGSPRIDSPRFNDEAESQLDRKISRYQSPGGRKQFSITNLLSRLIWKRSNKEEEIEKEPNDQKEKEKVNPEPNSPTKVHRRNSNANIISSPTSPEKEKRVRSISFTRKKSLSRGSLYGDSNNNS